MNFKNSYINSMNRIDFSRDFQERVIRSLTDNRSNNKAHTKHFKKYSVYLGFCSIILICLCIRHFQYGDRISDRIIADSDVTRYKDSAFCISEGDVLFYRDSELTENEKNSIVGIYIYCYETDSIQLEISGWRNLRYTAPADGTYSFFAVTADSELINLDQNVTVLTEATEESEDAVIFLE